MSEAAAVAVSDLWKTFQEEPVVAGVSFQVAPGRILALLGPSGCGKTTTLRLIAGFEQLDAGTVTIGRRTVAGEGHQLPPEQRRIGMVFQDYAIFPHLSVAENVAFGLKRDERVQRVTEMLAFVGLSGLGERMPHELSGGQQQRVALARALAPRPQVLLLDEPFSNLDAALRDEVRREVKSLLRQSRTTTIFVTHDQEEALFIGDSVAVMNNGRVEQTGAPEEVFLAPRTRFVAEFLGQTDFIRGEIRRQGIETALGTIPRHTGLPPETVVDVAVRPDDLALAKENGGNGRVTARQFMGIAYLYEVTLHDGSVVHSWQPHHVSFGPGTPVQATFRPGHTLPCFYDGQAI